MFCLVMGSAADFFIGQFLPPTEFQRANGFVGLSYTNCDANVRPYWDGYNFLGTFGLYVSSLAGDFTGVTMASHLKNRMYLNAYTNTKR